jgi:hypothetical protein
LLDVWVTVIVGIPFMGGRSGCFEATAELRGVAVVHCVVSDVYVDLSSLIIGKNPTHPLTF